MTTIAEVHQRVALAERRLDVAQPLHLTGEVESGPEPGTVRGVACRYSTPVDRGWGLWLELLPGCFAAAVRDPARVLMLWQHSSEEPIGRLTGLTDSPEELGFAGWITSSDDVPNGRRALSLLRDGIISQVSVGFRMQKYERIVDEDADTVTYRILKAHLMELSTVTFGAFGDDATVEEVFAVTPGAAAPLRAAAAVEAARLRARMARWV